MTAFNMENSMFEDVYLIKEEKSSFLKRWSSISISFLIHLTIILIVFLGPLLDSNIKLPELKVVNIYISKISPAPPVSLRAIKKISQKMSKLVNKNEKKENLSKIQNTLMIPLEIPEEIIDEDDEYIVRGIKFGSGGGLEDGIEGGFDDGILGGSLLGQNPVWLSKPERIKYVKPIYPPEALEAKIGASVIIEAITDVFGRVASWKIISGHSALNNAAIEAIQQWEYNPYIVNGIPKPVVFNVTIEFIPFMNSTDLGKN